MPSCVHVLGGTPPQDKQPHHPTMLPYHLLHIHLLQMHPDIKQTNWEE